MQTGKGIKRIADLIAFMHNHDQFPAYNEVMELRISQLHDRVANDPTDTDAITEINNTEQYLSQVACWQARYDEIYDKYFRILD